MAVRRGAAKEEVLVRRIGRNELDVIGLCNAYVGMQREYASEAHDGKPAGLFAQRLRSSPGHQDGLYWPKESETKSFGRSGCASDGRGYDVNKSSPTPFWGYNFRVLTAQGDAAPADAKAIS